MAPQSSLSLAVPLLLFAIFTVTPAEEGIIQRSKRRIQCGEFLICSEENRKPFEKRRKMAQSLVHFHKQIKWSGYVDQPEAFEEAKKYRADLCSDITTSGFMLEEGAENWPMACVWNGAGINGSETCAPYPFTGEKVFEFHEITKWRMSLTAFRKKIGCSDTDIYKAHSAEENYFCRDRCIHLGIGYVPQIVILASLMLAIYIFSKRT